MERNTLERAVLYGEYELTLDEKNRMLIPAEIRKQLVPERDGEAFFLVIGQQRKIWFLPEKYYYTLVNQRQSELTPDADVLAFNRMLFALACRVEWDKQGRAVIPDKILKRTRIEREVTLVGVGDRLELWNRSEWEAGLDDMIERSSELAFKAKQAQDSAVTKT